MTDDPRTALCAGCGLPGHRYGTTDTEHKYDAMGCVNALRAENRKLRDGLKHVLSGCAVSGCIECGYARAALAATEEPEPARIESDPTWLDTEG